ncbi:MAG: hypothetical protein AAGJ81_13770 [Verrucomicrobiota bacterium]
MKQSQRVRIFGVGFFAGCLLAAGFAFLRSSDEAESPLAPLPSWQTTTDFSGLPETPFALNRVVKAWVSPEISGKRWLVEAEDKSLWRITEGDDLATVIIQADEIIAMGNPGIETEALEAGLQHNEFEIISFNPAATRFVISVDPFLPDSVEQSIRILDDRKPYILEAKPLFYQAQ